MMVPITNFLYYVYKPTKLCHLKGETPHVKNNKNDSNQKVSWIVVSIIQTNRLN